MRRAEFEKAARQRWVVKRPEAWYSAEPFKHRRGYHYLSKRGPGPRAGWQLLDHCDERRRTWVWRVYATRAKHCELRAKLWQVTLAEAFGMLVRRFGGLP